MRFGIRRVRDPDPGLRQGLQEISGNAGPFLAPATGRRIHNRDRM